MKNISRKIGIILFVLGVTMLVTGILLAFTLGTVMVPILVSSSILVNSVGIILMQGPRPKKERRP